MQTNASLPLDRRHFLSFATALSAASLARAIEPMRRVGESHFKFSLAAYSYRKLLQTRRS